MNNLKSKEKNLLKAKAIFQIALLVTASFAIAFILSESVGVVSAQDEGGVAVSAVAVGAGYLLKKYALTQVTAVGGGFVGGGAALATLTEGLIYAGIGYLAGQLIGGLFGLESGQINALSNALAIGGAAYAVSQLAFGEGLFAFGGASFGIAAGVALVVFALTYKKTRYEEITYQCLPWQAPTGGNDCQRCNNDPLRPCSEYRCKSLGQACELVNKGTTEESCVWVSPNDVEAPVIKPYEDVLSPFELEYSSHDTLPPSRGTKIILPSNANGCLKPFTPLEFGITLDEPASCKLDYNHTDSFDEMKYYFGASNYLLQNHTQILSLPGANAEGSIGFDSPIIQNDGTTEFFVRCQDANENVNEAEFAIKFCVDPSPDTTAPRVEGSSIISGSPVQFDADEIPFELYVNEPAQCKWSRQDKNYDDLENEMSCVLDPSEINANLIYVCSDTLTGIENLKENNYYFKCRDLAENTMVESHNITLRGSQEINILEVLPNETQTGSSTIVSFDLEVETDDGADEGIATCFFSETGDEGSYNIMFETDSVRHKQNQRKPAGTYTYYFLCVDAGGNSANEKITFDVFVDNKAPIITRAYRDGTEALRINTNEDAECVYSLESCNYVFDEGLAMTNNPLTNKRAHFVAWDVTRGYYIKCRDGYGNTPNPNSCSIIARPSQIES